MMLNNIYNKYTDKKEIKISNISEFRIVTEQARYPLSNLREIFQTHNLNPDYQRSGVWDEKRKSKLIESFIINIPIPPIFLYEISFSKYEVMDGKQRISAILDFFDNNYPLEGLEIFPQYNNYYYKDLPEEVQNSVNRRYLSATILLKETAKNEEEEKYMKQLVFERLNTGGLELNKQEIRNAIFPSDFNKLLFELRNNKKFRDLMKFKQDSIDRMEDIELILRFFTYIVAIDRKNSKTTSSLLDDYMNIAMNFSVEEILLHKKVFTETINNVYVTFGISAFTATPNARKREKMIYDTIMLSTYLNLKILNNLDLDLSNEKFNIIRNNKEIFNGKYTSIQNVKERINILNNVIKSKANEN